MQSLESSRVLGLFAKQPEPGKVKTRLAARYSPAWSTAVAMAFLLDTLEKHSKFPCRRVLAYAPRSAETFFAVLAASKFELIPQTEGDLGQRMAAFFASEFKGGASAVVLTGTDSPNLPPAHLQLAFSALETADVVLGPALDGGYYLIGLRTFLPELFTDIPWSTSRVLGVTIDRLHDSRFRLELLPPWYDVDTVDDWRMLQGHVAADR